MKFAIIGDGRISKEYQKVLSHLDVKFDVFKREYKEKLLCNREHDYDGIIIAVNWIESAKVLRDFIGYYIPILVEKPVCLTSAEMNEIITSAEMNEIITSAEMNEIIDSYATDHVMVAYNRRFYKHIDKLIQLLRSNLLLSVRVVMPEPIKKYREKGIDRIDEFPLLYSGSHFFDLMLFLLGDLKIVYKDFDRALNVLNVVLKTHFNINVMVNVLFDTCELPRIEFTFANKVVLMRPLECMIVYNNVCFTDHRSMYQTFDYDSNEYGGNFKFGFLEQMKYFIDVFIKKEESKRITSHCTLEQALKVIKLTEDLTE